MAFWPPRYLTVRPAARLCWADCITNACQTWSEGSFVREFTHSLADSLPPNGQRVVWDLQNIFRFDDQGRLVEEWVRTDYRSSLRQLATEAHT